MVTKKSVPLITIYLCKNETLIIFEYKMLFIGMDSKNKIDQLIYGDFAEIICVAQRRQI
jgi:hypothetical protein